jgi:antitoxin (DNA-binding transcriptional repressor) of toxin-antitoxin stability system
MNMRRAEISELRDHLNDYLRLVEQGETVQVMDGNKVIAQMRPVEPPVEFPAEVPAAFKPSTEELAAERAAIDEAVRTGNDTRNGTGRISPETFARLKALHDANPLGSAGSPVSAALQRDTTQEIEGTGGITAIPETPEIRSDLDRKLDELEARGVIRRGKGKIPPEFFTAPRGESTASFVDALIEDREDRF